MGLRQLIPIVILIVQLYSVELLPQVVSLPRLRNNRLFEGHETELPGDFAEVAFLCGKPYDTKVKAGARLSFSEALTPSNFAQYGFTSGALSSNQCPKILGKQASFKFTTLNASKKMYALTLDPAGDPAYWLNQGESIKVPQHPKDHEPKYVFSADFSGCSWTVTPKSDGNMILRHVMSGQEGPQFNRLSRADKGGDITYAMQYVDYGYDTNVVPALQNRRAFAYMHYSGKHWQFHFQRQKCMPTSGSSEFKNDFLSAMSLTDHTVKEHISSAKTYFIP